jgi:DNA polymerase III alpha subunit (gram-positive type)
MSNYPAGAGISRDCSVWVLCPECDYETSVHMVYDFGTYEPYDQGDMICPDCGTEMQPNE